MANMAGKNIKSGIATVANAPAQSSAKPDLPHDGPNTESELLYDGPNEIATLMFAKLQKNIAHFKTLQSRKSMAEGNKEKAIADFIDSSQEPIAIQIRNQIRELQSQLRAFAEKTIRTEDLSEDDKKKLDEEFEAVRGKVAKGFETIPNVATDTDEDIEGVMVALHKLNNPTKSNRGRKPGTKGAEGPRASAVFHISGGNLDSPIQKDTFSGATLWLKCELKELQEAFASAAGVEFTKISEVNHPTEFDFLSHNNGQTYHIRTEPKVKMKPGRKPANPKGESAVATPAA